MQEPSFILVFFAGMLTILSPCILPIIPTYISYISGFTAIFHLNTKQRLKLLSHTFLFLFGIATSFTIIQVLIFYFANFATNIIGNNLFYNILGILIIIFGLHIMGIIRIRPLYFEKHVDFHLKKRSYFVSYLFGFTFGFGWSPCTSPTLVAVFAYISKSSTLLKGILFLYVYILGLGVPFILFSVFLEKDERLYRFLNKHVKFIEKISGILLILIGAMLFFNKLSIFNYLSNIFRR